MQKIAIIIPCYNEQNRLKPELLIELLEVDNISIYLVNDGSSDNTLQLLAKFAEQYPERCKVLHYEVNSGKANTIYKAVNNVLPMGYDFIGYFDADFSTPPSEIKRMLNEVAKNKNTFIFGSRVLLMNSQVKRKWYRHIIGRIIVTIINLKFKLGIYDTQCGAKIFSAETATIAFKDCFHTSWLFDVEVFIRLKQKDLLMFGQEFPLKYWRDIEGSKLGFRTAFKILKELNRLVVKY